MPHPFRCDIAPHRKPGGAVRLLALHNAVTPCDGHVVYHPLLHVVLVDSVVEKTKFRHVCFLVGLFTQELAAVLSKVNLVGWWVGEGVGFHANYNSAGTSAESKLKHLLM